MIESLWANFSYSLQLLLCFKSLELPNSISIKPSNRLCCKLTPSVMVLFEYENLFLLEGCEIVKFSLLL